MTGIIGCLHSFIFFVVGFSFLKTILKSSKVTENKTKKRKYAAFKILGLTIIIGLCSIAALVHFVSFLKDERYSTKQWINYLFSYIIFELIPSFALLFTYLQSANQTYGGKNKHMQLTETNTRSVPSHKSSNN